MSKTEILRKNIIEEIKNLNEAELAKLLKAAQILKLKNAIKKSECALLSEASLANDWLTPEEDSAWQNQFSN